MSNHHPFTAPASDDLDPKTAKSKGYDIVLNGYEVGLDRIVMLMAGKETLREVTAFPKAQSGADPLTGAPAPVDAAQLREVGLQVLTPTKEQRARAGEE